MKLTALALVVATYTNNVYAHELRGGYVFAEEEVKDERSMTMMLLCAC